MSAVAPAVLELRATLPLPPGINHTYRAGRGRHGDCARVYLTPAAREWTQSALLTLRAAGWRRLPTGMWWLSLDVTLVMIRHDIDAPVKALLDVVAAALGVDDRQVGHLDVIKVRAGSPADKRLEVFVRAGAVADLEEWNARSLSQGGTHRD